MLLKSLKPFKQEVSLVAVHLTEQTCVIFPRVKDNTGVTCSADTHISTWWEMRKSTRDVGFKNREKRKAEGNISNSIFICHFRKWTHPSLQSLQIKCAFYTKKKRETFICFILLDFILTKQRLSRWTSDQNCRHSLLMEARKQHVTEWKAWLDVHNVLSGRVSPIQSNRMCGSHQPLCGGRGEGSRGAHISRHFYT